MTDEDEYKEPRHRIKFYGVGDLATGCGARKALSFLRSFADDASDRTINDIIEIDNVLQYEKSGSLRAYLNEAEYKKVEGQLPKLHRVVTTYMRAVSDENATEAVKDLDFEYHRDCLSLVMRHKVADRVAVPTLFGLLQSAGILLSDFLSNQSVAKLFDAQLRILIVGDSRSAEVVVRSLLDGGIRVPQVLPPSLTSEDIRRLVLEYIQLEDANMNTLQLIVGARMPRGSAIDKRVKIQAKRRLDTLTEELFKGNPGFKTGCSVELVDDQEEPVKTELDGNIVRFAYGRKWLEEDLTFPTILNNFAHLFNFVDIRMALELPSYASDLGVLERFMGTHGKDDYVTGIEFQLTEQRSFLQTLMYDRFLRMHEIELEVVLKWFFVEYIPDEFGAPPILFNPSSPGATLLERDRHLFSEMEGVLAQFTLFVEDGVIDLELLALASEQVDYHKVPSLVEQKYAYLEGGSDLAAIVNILYSDQSGLTYINDTLRGRNAAHLIVSHEVSYDDFLDHQKPSIDFLIKHGVLVNDDNRVKFVSADRANLLLQVFTKEVISRGHANEAQRDLIDEMSTKGWVSLASSLLSKPEADFFDYMLNQKSYGNGPELRNKYSHASAVSSDGESQHFNTYLTLLNSSSPSQLRSTMIIAYDSLALSNPSLVPPRASGLTEVAPRVVPAASSPTFAPPSIGWESLPRS